MGDPLLQPFQIVGVRGFHRLLQLGAVWRFRLGRKRDASHEGGNRRRERKTHLETFPKNIFQSWRGLREICLAPSVQTDSPISEH